MLSALADRLGAHPRRTLLFVLVFALFAGAVGGPVAGVLQTSGGFRPTDADSVTALDRVAEATGREASSGVVLLVATPQGATAPAGTARVKALQQELAAVPGIAAVRSAADGNAAAFTAINGRSTYLAATLSASADSDDVAATVLERFKADRDVQVGGAAVGQKQIGDTTGADLGRAETLAFPILLLLSLLFFRGGRAAAIPLAIGLSTILTTFLVLRGINELYGLSIFALNLVIGLGLGLAIDYSLFLVTRFREEMATQGPGAAAIRTTLQTAGRTVLYSASTVAAALITLTLFPLGFLKSMGIAGAVVALAAAAMAVILTPAFFALWGAKLTPRQRRGAAAAGGEHDGRWYRLSIAVMRRPGVVAVVTGLAMIVAGLPALRAEFTPVDTTAIPLSKSARTVADTLRTQYRGQDTNPVLVVLDAPRSATAEVERYASTLGALGGAAGAAPPRAIGPNTWQIDVLAEGAPDGDGARALVHAIRDGAAPGKTLVAGAAAEFVDQQAAIGSRLPLALALLALLTFGILWVMTGSVVLPFKAIVMNLLTVGSSLGVLTLIFQDGRLQGLLNYTSNGGVEPTDFLVSAALIFALSTDYGVFLLERIKEARIPGRSEREAVAIGLERTGAVVTAAAILLAVAIGAFVTSSISFIQQIGVAAATGVLLDAFVVRALLVPALMGLLGSWNWWSPAPLRHLHERLERGRAARVPERAAA